MNPYINKGITEECNFLRECSNKLSIPWLQEIISAGLLSIIEPEHQHGYIANVCVTKQARRKGIASSLLRVAINAAKCWSKFVGFTMNILSRVRLPINMGKYNMYAELKDLYVHVNVNNAAAQRLYKKSGFQVCLPCFAMRLKCKLKDQL
jgi:ribosomal protein S18 acetylase RimI-like enzyme